MAAPASRGLVGGPAPRLVHPHRHDGTYHWHVHLVPRLTSVAGFEQGTGVAINVLPPESAAQRLGTSSSGDYAPGVDGSSASDRAASTARA